MKDIKQIGEHFIQAFNAHDVDEMVQLYAEDATYMLPAESEPLHGRKAIKESYEMFFRAFPDMSSEITFSMASGEHFLAECIVRGTHAGPLASPQGDVPPTGRKIELKMAFVAKVTEDGLVAEDRTYYDSAVMMNQLGLN